MVIVRESPKKQQSNPDQQWPPRSPFDALLSSPSGRKRYQERLRDNSASPSSAKRRKIDDDEDEDDEETLQLKLQAIEAKLKLKKLQRAKEKLDTGSDPFISKPEIGKDPDVLASTVQVPLSPTRGRPDSKNTSPARVLLGIDKGLRAQDVSLRRAASARRSTSKSSQSSQLSRSNSTNPPKKSFADRLLESRASQLDKEAKNSRITNARTRGFGLLNRTPNDETTETPAIKVTQDAALSLAESSKSINRSTHAPEADRHGAAKDSEDSHLEPYTGFRLRNRQIDHTSLTRTFTGKQLFSIPQLFKQVKSPEYEAPDCESDYVVFAIIAGKSSPIDHKNPQPKLMQGAASEQPVHRKFMVVKLTDLKWELDLFLFNSGFETFFKLTPGTVIAILNPGIMPPNKNKASGAFSLTLSSSEDTVLEIGKAADLGFCKAMKRDGHECHQWVDARKTEFCEFHISLKVDKARKDRMQLNTMIGGATTARRANGSAGGSRPTSSSRFAGNSGPQQNQGLIPEGKYYDKTLHETLYIAPRELGFNATRLLDDQDADVNAWQRGCSKEEWARRRNSKMEKEKELARKLKSWGTGAGSQYLGAGKQTDSAKASSQDSGRQSSTSASAAGEHAESASTASSRLHQITSSSASSSAHFPPEVDAQSLGLLGKKAEDVSLDPTAGKKRKRVGTPSEPVGWGGANKRGLLQRENSSSLTGAGLGGDSAKSSSSTATSAAASLHSGIQLKSTLKDPGQVSPKKNARFMLDKKGIRLPGRESLGTTAGAVEDSEDDLEIV